MCPQLFRKPREEKREMVIMTIIAIIIMSSRQMWLFDFVSVFVLSVVSIKQKMDTFCVRLRKPSV